MSDDQLEKSFPKLRATKYKVASPATRRYNCIAWAAGDDRRFWWPKPIAPYYWPKEVPLEESLGNFIRVFQLLGYEVCKSDELEPNFEKVAIYMGANGIPKHAARQTISGAWTSKLGSEVDIEHDTLDAISGIAYGS